MAALSHRRQVPAELLVGRGGDRLLDSAALRN